MRLWELEEGDGDDVVPGGERPVEIPEEEEHGDEAPVEAINEAVVVPAADIPQVVMEAEPADLATKMLITAE